MGCTAAATAFARRGMAGAARWDANRDCSGVQPIRDVRFDTPAEVGSSSGLRCCMCPGAAPVLGAVGETSALDFMPVNGSGVGMWAKRQVSCCALLCLRWTAQRQTAVIGMELAWCCYHCKNEILGWCSKRPTFCREGAEEGGSSGAAPPCARARMLWELIDRHQHVIRNRLGAAGPACQRSSPPPPRLPPSSLPPPLLPPRLPPPAPAPGAASPILTGIRPPGRWSPLRPWPAWQTLRCAALRRRPRARPLLRPTPGW